MSGYFRRWPAEDATCRPVRTSQDHGRKQCPHILPYVIEDEYERSEGSHKKRGLGYPNTSRALDFPNAR